jgi:hypothetical protein
MNPKAFKQNKNKKDFMNSIIKLIVGFLSVISIGLGGLVISNGLYNLQKSGEIVSSWYDGTTSWSVSALRYEWGFFGFFLVGLGFWLIVAIGKVELKQKSS